MKKRIFAIVLAVMLCVGTLGGCEGNKSEPHVLKGLWTPQAICYENRVYAMEDVDGLKDLYDTTFLTVEENGDFSFFDIYFYDGTCLNPNKDADGNDTYILKTNRSYTMNYEDGEVVNKEVGSGTPKSYIVTTYSSDPNTIRIHELNSKTGGEALDGMPLYLVRDGAQSSLIDSIKEDV